MTRPLVANAIHVARCHVNQFLKFIIRLLADWEHSKQSIGRGLSPLERVINYVYVTAQRGGEAALHLSE